LSAFLLTYRLWHDYQKANTYKDILFLTIKYAIRRFFRIYVTAIIFALFLCYVLYLTFNLNKINESMEFFIHLREYKGVYDKYVGMYWTIPHEIKFYFVLPFLVFIFWKYNKLWQTFLIIFITNCLYFYYYFKILGTYSIHNFSEHLIVFLFGYTVAILYIKLEQHNILEYLKDLKVFNYTICFITYIMFIDGHRSGYIYSYLKRYFFTNSYTNWGLYWSIFLFLMLIGEPNHFTNNLNESKLLKNYGKYSYGVYLINIYVNHLNDKYFKPDFDGLLFVCLSCYWFAFLFYHLLEKNMIKLANLIIFRLENSNYKLLPMFYYKNRLISFIKH
jgi:peptidoglycan/LPS O-acetylase OafA/YrhL